MAFLQFPQTDFFRILETDSTTRMGSFQIPVGTELDHMMLTILVKGLIVTTINLRVKIFGSDMNETPEIVSDWVELSVDTLVSSPAYTTGWFGNIYVDFSGEPINPNVTYYMTCETSGYTRNGDTFYMGLNLDWNSPVNTSITPSRAGARVRILGHR